jgi:hypothetical protein
MLQASTALGAPTSAHLMTGRTFDFGGKVEVCVMQQMREMHTNFDRKTKGEITLERYMYVMYFFCNALFIHSFCIAFFSLGSYVCIFCIPVIGILTNPSVNACDCNNMHCC